MLYSSGLFHKLPNGFLLHYTSCKFSLIINTLSLISIYFRNTAKFWRQQNTEVVFQQSMFSISLFLEINFLIVFMFNSVSCILLYNTILIYIIILENQQNQNEECLLVSALIKNAFSLTFFILSVPICLYLYPNNVLFC